MQLYAYTQTPYGPGPQPRPGSGLVSWSRGGRHTLASILVGARLSSSSTQYFGMCHRMGSQAPG